jgi:hypothetical protein
MSYQSKSSRTTFEEGGTRLDPYLAPNYVKSVNNRPGHKSSISKAFIAAQSTVSLDGRGRDPRPRTNSSSNIVQTQLALEDIQSFNARVDATTQCQNDTTEQIIPIQLPTLRPADSKGSPLVVIPVAASAQQLPSPVSTQQDSTVPSLVPSGSSIEMISPLQTTKSPRPPRPPRYFEAGLMPSPKSQAETSSNVEWEQIQKLRIEVWGLRSLIHEMRNTLREKQEAKSKADDILFRRMNMQGLGVLPNQNYALGRGQKKLAELMEDCQRARDEYGPVEDECIQAEDRLSNKEFALTNLEKQYYKRPNPPNIAKPNMSNLSTANLNAFDHTGPPPLPQNEDEYAREIENSEYHPKVTEYLSKLGDLDLLQERLDEHLDEKESLEVEKASRLRFGLALDTEDQDWLDASHTIEDNLIEKINLLQKDLESKKQECFAMGLVDEDGEATNFQRQEQFSFRGEVDPQNQKSEYVKYPLLLLRSGVKLEEALEFEPGPDERSDTTTSRINEWMLEKLRMSVLDVNLLARTFEAWVGGINDEWQFSVLKLWYKDGTIEAAGRYRVYTSSMTSQAPPLPSNHSDPAPKPRNDEESFGLFFASSNGFRSGPLDKKEIDLLTQFASPAAGQV